MPTEQENSKSEREKAGLCFDCLFCRRQESKRGSMFLRCGRADTEPDFNRYPELPVRECRGYESREPPGIA